MERELHSGLFVGRFDEQGELEAVDGTQVCLIAWRGIGDGVGDLRKFGESSEGSEIERQNFFDRIGREQLVTGFSNQNQRQQYKHNPSNPHRPKGTVLGFLAGKRSVDL